MVARVIDGKAIAARVRTRLAGEVAEHTKRYGVPPGLSVVLVGDDPASVTYVGAKEKASREAGMIGEAVRLPSSASQEQVISAVEALNRDPARHGILVQLPLPGQIDTDTVVSSIDPAKDVDGLHPYNFGLLLAGKPRFAPATPSGIQQMLIEEGVETSGAHVVICGRSNIVGRPLAAIMLGRGKGANATVTVCHTGTRDLKSVTRSADILVAAAGKPDLIRGDMIREGAVVIDVGVNRIPDPSRKTGFRLVGDVRFDEAVEVASLITPVPGGVGPMTIAMLLQNTLMAARGAHTGK
ncbi:MAG: bifunctional 5,10-methylenetetrahydrofolate dehydrogenase/5,10-methenyltetrahydrofolate cyclohydrolase [Chloroflexi bacterium]|nr:bifunctional 5,10-methylenetetrahydrofolate dehydrogenase/5,10-methenyltetrahydrofolate cyclohydrolase [Chloroflexota bacterium]